MENVCDSCIVFSFSETVLGEVNKVKVCDTMDLVKCNFSAVSLNNYLIEVYFLRFLQRTQDENANL